jgi:4-hydroxy-tetrahydrodipicolinate synthase
MMQQATYGGVNAAVLTAMRDDLSIDIDRTAAHCRWLLANGCTGLAILGTTSEANSLGMDERIALMEGLVERGIPAARLLPGTGTTAIPDTVKLTRKAAELGCPGVLVLPPFFYKNPSDDGLFAYFSEVINRVGGGPKIYLYHFPAQSAVPFGVAFIGRLLRAFPGVMGGIKDSSGNFANTKSYIDAYAKDGFEVYCGDDGTLLDTLAAGGAGCITAAANMGCAVSARVVANWNKPEGAAAQAQLTKIRAAVVSAPLIPALKTLVARRTGDAGWETIRPPHLKLSREVAAKLFETFDACAPALADAA